MRYLKVLSLCGLLFFWGLPSQAAQLNGLYEAEVVVANQGRGLRTTAMSEAMAAVLLKVSGSSAVLGEEVIQSAMADAARYVQQYRYRSEAIPSGKRQVAKNGKPAADSRLLLSVGFDSASIDKLLRRFGFTVWSSARPATLVWLAIEEGSRRVLVGANDQGLVREVLEAEAQRRALPLLLPLLDLTDRSKVRPAEIWGGFLENIETASQRYEAQAILIGKLYSTGGRWEAHWTLRYQGQEHVWQKRAKGVRAVIASGVGGSSDYLLQHFAKSSYLGVDQLALRIEGVDGMSAFRRVNDYLLSLHGVEAVTLRRVDASSNSFLVQIEGSREAVLQAITMGDVLVKVETPVPESLLSPEFTTPPQWASSTQPAPQPELPQSGVDAQIPADNTEQPIDNTELPPQQPQVAPLQELVYRLLS
ncbi:MAG: DUF2066 domain-containing protein [Pseudomonadota bacterium]